MRSADQYPLGQGAMKWTCAQWLRDNLEGDFLLLDCQPNIHDYIKEHIPGAVYFNPDHTRVSQGGVPGRFIPAEAAAALFSQVGVRPEHPTIVYTGAGPFKNWGDGLEQTMIAYSLMRYGAKEVWLLDGGMETWKQEGGETAQIYPSAEGSDFRGEVQEDFYIAYEQVKEIKDRDDVMVLDARPPDFYEGQGPWRKPGHIPGSISFPWRKLFTDDNPRLLKEDAEIQSLLDGAGITPEHHVICSCGTGREATAEFLISKYLLGFPHVRIYEGAFTEWCHYDEPTATGPEPG